jgi:hypothetical protein
MTLHPTFDQNRAFEPSGTHDAPMAMLKAKWPEPSNEFVQFISRDPGTIRVPERDALTPHCPDACSLSVTWKACVGQVPSSVAHAANSAATSITSPKCLQLMKRFLVTSIE